MAARRGASAPGVRPCVHVPDVPRAAAAPNGLLMPLASTMRQSLPEPMPPTPAVPAAAKQLPAVTAMAWLCVDSNGSSALLQCDKWRLAEKLGIQARDLRLLDPQLSSAASPCAILCRERWVGARACVAVPVFCPCVT